MNKFSSTLLAFGIIACFILLLLSGVVVLVFGDYAFNKGSLIQRESLHELKNVESKILLICNNNPEKFQEDALHVIGFVDVAKKQSNMEFKVFEGIDGNIDLLEKIVEDESNNGYKDIFLVGFDYTLELMNMFRNYSDVMFYYYEGRAKEKNVINYSPRRYEIKYLQGMLAGAYTRTNEIGYVVNYKHGVAVNNINAFALGVKKINPSAYVYVAWNNSNDSVKSDELINNLLKSKNIDVITGSLPNCGWCDIAERNKVSYISQLIDDSAFRHSQYYLGSYIFDTRIMYSSFLAEISYGHRNNNGKDIWFGADRKVLRPIVVERKNPNIPYEPYLSDILEQMRSGSSFIFAGRVQSNRGIDVIPPGGVVTDEALAKQQSWFNKNVIEFNQSSNTVGNSWSVGNINLKVYNRDQAIRLAERLSLRGHNKREGNLMLLQAN